VHASRSSRALLKRSVRAGRIAQSALDLGASQCHFGHEPSGAGLSCERGSLCRRIEGGARILARLGNRGELELQLRLIAGGVAPAGGIERGSDDLRRLIDPAHADQRVALTHVRHDRELQLRHRGRDAQRAVVELQRLCRPIELHESMAEQRRPPDD
jgi:hypothetical protein